MRNGQDFYRGRFAPSPTGPLHFGSLVAACGSFLEARTRGGEWRLRIEDLDQPRCSPAAAEAILRSLEAFGFDWDGEVVWQSRRADTYEAALAALKAAGLAYPCACTRRELADSLLAPDGATIYPGTCRDGLAPGRSPRAWRLRVGAARICFDDAVQGPIECELAREVGDFVLRRADGIHAYQLAVVVDDAEAGITDVVRGADLLASTARQIHLQRCLGLPTPRYAHLPVAVDANGDKLSKQTLATPLVDADQVLALHAAFRFLGQTPPAELARGTLGETWTWARRNWDLARVPRGPATAAMA